MNDDNVVNLAERKNNNSLWTPEQMMLQAASDLRAGKVTASRAIVILLDDSTGDYAVTFRSANMKSSEGVALMEATKMMLLRDMGFVK